MTRTTRKMMLALTAGVLSLSAVSAVAADNLEFSGKIWAHYTYDLTSGSQHVNGFDLYRTFFQAGYKFDDTWSSVLLLDTQHEGTALVGNPNSGATALNAGPLRAYARDAYVQAWNLWEGNGYVRFGLQPVYYITTVDSATRTRWLGLDLVDRTGMLPEDDAAVSAGGMVGNFLKYGVMVRNGAEGFQAPVSDDAVAFNGGVTFMPMANSDDALAKSLGITISDDLKQIGHDAAGNQTTPHTNLLAAALHGNTDWIDFALEYAFQSDNSITNGTNVSGYGATVNLKAMDEKVSLFAQYQGGNDTFKNLRLMGTHFFAVGPTYSFVKNRVQTAVIYSNTGMQAGNANQAVAWDWAMTF